MTEPEPQSQPQPQPQPRPASQIHIELPAGLEPIYANFAVVVHSPSEAGIDFARVMPTMPRSFYPTNPPSPGHTAHPGRAGNPREHPRPGRGGR